MKIQNDIYKYQFRSAMALWAMAVVAIVAVVVSVWTATAAMKESRESAYLVNAKGEVLPLQLAELRDAEDIRIKQLLSLFVDYYYNLDQYNWYEKTNKALWLGNLRADRKNKEDLGYYNQFVQTEMKQKAVLAPEDIEVGRTDGVIWFKIQIQLIRESPIQASKKYLLFAKGTVREASLNFPRNPQGFYIENYKEDKTIEVEK